MSSACDRRSSRLALLLTASFENLRLCFRIRPSLRPRNRLPSLPLLSLCGGHGRHLSTDPHPKSGSLLKVYEQGVNTIGPRMSQTSIVIASQTLTVRIVAAAAKREGVVLRIANAFVSLGVDIVITKRNQPKKTERNYASLQHSSAEKQKIDAPILGSPPFVLIRQRRRFAVHLGSKPGWCTTTLV